MIVSISSKFPTDDCFSRTIGDSTLLPYFSLSKELKLYYSTHFSEFVVIYVCVLSRKYV